MIDAIRQVVDAVRSGSHQVAGNETDTELLPITESSRIPLEKRLMRDSPNQVCIIDWIWMTNRITKSDHDLICSTQARHDRRNATTCEGDPDDDTAEGWRYVFGQASLPLPKRGFQVSCETRRR